MKKSTVMKILSLIVGVVIIASSLVGVFGVNAADPAEGTAEKGIVNEGGSESGSSINEVNMLATKGLMNGDFEQGLKYWTTTHKGTNVYPTEDGSVVKDGENSYFKYNGSAGDSFRGLRSTRIVISKDKLNIGDKVAVMFDYLSDKGSYNFQVKHTQVLCGGNKSESNSFVNACTVFNDATASNSWKTLVTVPSAGSVTTSTTPADAEKGIAQGDYSFFITLAVASNKTCTAGIDNVRLVKVVDGKYYNIEDGSEITKRTEGGGSNPGEGGGENPDPTPSADPAWAGTVTDGMVFENTSEATYTVNSKGPVEANTNLDFHKGLMYWAPTGKFSDTALPELKASAAVSYKKEGTRNYIQFDNVARSGWCGIKSPKLSIPADKLSVGDQFVLLYDLKGDKESPLQFNVELRNTKTGSTGLRSEYQNATELKTVDGWTTFATKPGMFNGVDLSSNNPGLTLGDIVLQIEAKVISNKQSDACLSNFRIAKLKDNAYYDVYTGTKYVVETSGGSTSGGSGNGSGSTTGGSGTGASTGKSNKTGESITLLASLFVLSAAGVFGTAKALKKR